MRVETGNQMIYWEASTWIKLFQESEVADDESVASPKPCQDILQANFHSGFRVCASAFTYLEVFKYSRGKATNGNILDLDKEFRKWNVLVVPLNRRCGIAAQQLIHNPRIQIQRMDAIHVAAAQLINATEIHTLDGGLLSLSNRIENRNGQPIRICLPRMPG